MSATRKDQQTKKSERLLEINWRDDDHDSTRNPVVDASREIFGDDEYAEVDAFIAETYSAASTAADNQLEEDEDAQIVVDSWVTFEDETVLVNDSVASDSVADTSVEEEAESGYSDATDLSTVTLKIDEVFEHIAPYRAVVDNGISDRSLLGRSLLAQANAIFNTAFLNLQSKVGFVDVFAAAPASASDETRADITSAAIREVLRLQRLV